MSKQEKHGLQETAVLAAIDSMKSAHPWGPKLSEVKEQIGGKRRTRGNLWKVSRRLVDSGQAEVKRDGPVNRLGGTAIIGGYYRIKRIPEA